MATCLVGVGSVAGALVLDLEALAEATSTFLLLVFTIINVALIRLKRRTPSPGFAVPAWVPVVGFVGSATALVVSVVL